MSSLKKHLSRFVFLALISLSSLSSAEDIYRIDLIIFQYLPKLDVEEKFETPEISFSENIIKISQLQYPEFIQPESLDIGLEYKELFQDISISSFINNENLSTEKKIDVVEMSEKQIFFQEDLGKEFALEDINESIRRSKNYRLITSKSWFQPIISKESGDSILINSEVVEGVKIFGEIKPYKKRFLHLDANLFYSEETFQEELNLLEIDVKEYLEEGTLKEKKINITSAEGPFFKIKYEIKQSRKLRSKELHYIDHPKFGVIFQISPLNKN